MLLGGALETLPRANSVPEKRFVLDARIVVIIRIVLEIIVKGRSNPNSIRNNWKAQEPVLSPKVKRTLKTNFRHADMLLEGALETWPGARDTHNTLMIAVLLL